MFFRVFSSNKTTVFNCQSEGLPNITGTFHLFEGHGNHIGFDWVSGCFTADYPGSVVDPDGGADTAGWYNRRGIINAQLSNKIYGNSEHVTPCNVTIKVWQRIS